MIHSVPGVVWFRQSPSGSTWARFATGKLTFIFHRSVTTRLRTAGFEFNGATSHVVSFLG